MSVSNQMMKGLLDGAILGLIAKGETYGYEILEKLKENQFPEISDGSIYPVLLRKGYVHNHKSDNGGPKRKYYTISESGQEREIQREKGEMDDLTKNNLFGSENMMTKEQEDYIFKLKAELMFRGKDEGEVHAIGDELQDHFEMAEANVMTSVILQLNLILVFMLNQRLLLIYTTKCKLKCI